MKVLVDEKVSRDDVVEDVDEVVNARNWYSTRGGERRSRKNQRNWGNLFK
jgi:hypothetical protein